MRWVLGTGEALSYRGMLADNTGFRDAPDRRKALRLLPWPSTPETALG